MKTLINTLALISTVLFTGYVSSANAAMDGINNFGDWDNHDASLIVGFGSYHYDKEDHKYLNESNPAIGLEIWDISVVYIPENSWENTSFYVTYNPDFYESKWLTVSGNIGFATGYGDDEKVVRGTHTYTGTTPTWMGLAPLFGITTQVNLTDNFSLTATATPVVAMFGGRYNF